ncbi:MAG: ATP-binding protein [Gemmatimonadales bacterium]|nr:ATP-binding protein [Gemmatimonadales bacterium]
MRPDVVAFVGQQATQALLAVVFAVAHYALFRHDRRQFLWLWAAGWCGVALAHALTGLEALTSPEPGLLVPAHPALGFVSDWAGTLAVAALGAGTRAFDRDRNNPARTLGVLALIAAGLALATAVFGQATEPPWRYPVRTGLAGAACLLAAPLFWRGGADRRGARIVAALVASYAIPMFGYTWITLEGDGVLPGHTLDRFVAIGGLDTVLMAAMALAMIVWLLERERGAAATAMDRERSLRAEIEQREAQVRSILHSVPDAIAVLDAAGRYLVDLRPDREFLGIPNQRLMGASILDLVHPDDRERAEGALGSIASRPGAAAVIELRIRHGDGRWLTLECSGTNCVDVPSLGGILVVARDVTARRDLERRLAQAERLETVGRLAGGVAHDFNNLLTVVRGNAALLTDRLAGRMPESAWTDEIGQAAIRGANLTRHLLAFARRQPVEPRVFDLGVLVSDLLPILRRLVGESIDLDWSPPSEPALVRADPHQLEQVVVNLCANARDAMPGGGPVSLRVRRDRGDVVLVVRDAGVGMTEATRARAFEPFFTTKPPSLGAGLGLATCYGIVEQAGGAIALDSNPGSGTTVTVRLPVAAGPVVEASAPPPPARLRGQGTVLVVEDEPAVRAVAARSLRAAGFDVVEASDGIDAAERLAGIAPIGVVTDLVMPRRSGDALARQVWTTQPHLPILFTSGYSQEFRPDSIGPTHRWSFLQKPYEPEALIRAAVSLFSAGPAMSGQ